MVADRMQLLTPADETLASIEQTGVRLLAEVGIALEGRVAREMLHGLGCTVGDDGRTRIPEQVVEWALANVTPHRHYYRLDGTPAFQLGDGRVRCHNGGGPPFVYDGESGGRRPATLCDLAQITRLLDALPHVSEVTPLFGPQDVPAEMLPVSATHQMMLHTRKPVSSAALEKAEHVPFVVAMAAACCGGADNFRARPTLSISVSPVSPLRFPADIANAMIAVVEAGAPLHPLPAPSLGATAPITLAAGLAQQHAEILASFVIAAATRAGAAVTYCSRLNPINVRSAVSAWGGPEVGMAGAAAARLAQRLGLPCDTYGLASSAGVLDPQFAYERLANALLPALAGADMLSGVGAGGSGLVGGLEIAVVDDEIMRLLQQITKGVRVDEETLAFELMEEVISRDGVFLAEAHTVDQMRAGALWIPEKWADGSNSADASFVARAREQAEALLQSHEVEPWPEHVIAELDEIMAQARRELLPA